MNLEIKPFCSSFKETPKFVKNVTILWCDDGWSYIPELNLRRQYYAIKKSMKLRQELWEGTIPLPLHSEQVQLSQYSEMVWREVSEDHDDLFSVSTTNQNTNT